MPETNIDGALAAALAKAQGEFPAISRDKEVTVQTKTGGSYKFKYAPLDSIINAVRKPLAANGLAITQLLDAGDLVTMLLHKDGASLSGRTPLPNVDGVQAFGSAITYLRRYSLQAILGIAAEEDDDGNHATGNTTSYGGVVPPPRPAPDRLPPRDDLPPLKPARTDQNGLIGLAITQGTQDGELRPSPTGGWTLPFRVKDGGKSYIVLAEDQIARDFADAKSEIIGQRVTVWGRWSDETIPAKGTKPEVRYRILHLERIQTPDVTIPAPSLEPDLPQPPEDVELVGEDEPALGLVV